MVASRLVVTVLRLGHRKERDKRVSTHVGLSARALGAKAVVYTGEDDEGLVKSVNSVGKNWGGSFRATYVSNWRSFLKKFKGVRVHLTMYGTPVEQAVPEILRAATPRGKKARPVLVVVGAEKVPPDVYKLCEFNVSVTTQPHSEIAALAVLLDRLYTSAGRKTVGGSFARAKIAVKPNARGKTVVRR